MALGFSRREVLAGGCAAMGLAACDGNPGVPAPTPRDTSDPWPTGGATDTGTGADQPCVDAVQPGAAGWTGFPLADYPDLEVVGGWYGVTAGGRSLVLAHVIDGCYVAIDRACAHEGVPIDYRPDRGQFVCPRHGAIYDWFGEKVAGPQPDGLPTHPAGRDGDTVWVYVA